MNKTVNFIFMDESVSEEANLASLTGLIVPLEEYEKVRKDYYLIINDILNFLYTDRKEQRICHSPPILHGHNFLRNSEATEENSDFDFSLITDEFRIEILKRIIDIINKNNLLVVRIGYSNFKEINDFSRLKDEKLHNLNWLGLFATISNNFNNTMFIPVMEGIDWKMVPMFCNMIWSANYKSELYPDIYKSFLYNESNSFMSSVLFTKSKFTETIQIVDIISYLLQKVDFAEITGKCSNFTKILIDIISTLKEDCLINSIKKMNIAN